jgi:RHS repeat-associated protein
MLYYCKKNINRLGDKVILETNGTDTIHYSYDSSGNLVSMNLNGLEYYYVRNGQGDIIALIDANGNEVVSYTCDSWGNVVSIDGSLATTVGVKNPYRYRGYRYDEETKLYYLQSRYYNPEWGRFINADDVKILSADDELIGNNLFSYCTNDPVNNSDDSGYWKMPNWAKVAIGVTAIGISVAVTAATGGSAAPVLMASLKIAAASAASRAAISVVSNRISTGSWSGSTQAALDGAADGFMWGGITSGVAVIGVAAKGIKIQSIGRMSGANTEAKYIGIRYLKGNKIRSVELHTPHNGHGWHLQSNKWTLQNPKFPGQYYRTGVAWRKTLFGK